MRSDQKEGAKRYNGWANYETWCVHLWLSNEEGSYRYWREEAERQWKEAPKSENVKSGIWSVEDAAKFNLADQMKESFETFHPFRGEHLAKPNEPDVFCDLLDSALSEVRWSEVAEAFLEGLEPEEPEQTEDDDQEEDEEEASTSEQPNGQLFSLGRVVSTRGALAALSREDIKAALQRHAAGDWGEVPDADRKENDLSIRKGYRVFSIFRGQNDCRFWVITEADRSSTTVLLPEEY